MNRWLGGAVMGLIVIGFLLRNVPWHLDDLDQAKQAFTSFEMIQDGQWWFQHTPRGKVATKPPLAGWISAGLFSVTRSWDWSWRLPSLLSALGMVAILWRAGERYWVGGGMIAAAAFGLNLFVPRLATLVRTDMLLTLSIFGAGYIIYEKLRTKVPWTTKDRWLLFAVLVASVLTKGPIAYGFLLPGLVAFLIIQRRREELVAGGSGWWPWLLPLVVFGVWVGIGIAQSPEFYNQVVRKEFLGRFTVGEEAVHNNLPPGTYTVGLLGRFLPWSLALVALASLRSVRSDVARRPELLWLACWAVGGLVFMECVPSKRFDRILPVVPPLCLLLTGMAGGWESPRRGRLASVAVISALLLSGGYLAFEVVKAFRTDQQALVRFGEQVRALAEQNGWRYELLGTKDEGMLLYLRRTHFADDADEAWARGELDGLIVSEPGLAKNRASFEPFTVALQTEKTPEKSSRYFFIIRRAVTSPP